MNIRKPTNYGDLFAALNELMTADLPQMELYCGVGRIVSDRPEKGAAVATAEYLQRTYPNATGFSPRNLRRMRNFYRAYENTPSAMAEAMTIGWTQNVVIMEADLTLQEKVWYICAVRQFGWSKLKLVEQIASSAHQKIVLDSAVKERYTGGNDLAGCLNDDQYLFNLLQSEDRICDEKSGEENQTENPVLHQANQHQHQENWRSNLSLDPQEIGQAWAHLCRRSDRAPPQHQLGSIRPSWVEWINHPVEYASLLWQRFCQQDTPANRVYYPP